MVGATVPAVVEPRLVDTSASLDVEAFEEICSPRTDPADYPLALTISSNIPIYSGSALLARLSTPKGAHSIMAEWHRCLLRGPGVFVIERMFDPAADAPLLERCDAAFDRIIADEAQGRQTKGDHFAAGGKNDRIWNSFQKHAVESPQDFVEYYSNQLIALASEAWLGPGYEITAQVNIVKPGGAAQKPHRDYHLGFQSQAVTSLFPLPTQAASQLLTLQGAVAHSDMPLPTGPTQLLPYSQLYPYGYLAYRDPSFATAFARLAVQLPLARGDGLFFNPALFHAAGENVTQDVRRSANLLQVSSAFGKAMESVDRGLILKRVWDALKALWEKEGEEASLKVQAAVKAIADGYAFPTNLDLDPPPANGHCPPTQQDLVFRGLAEGWDAATFGRELDEYLAKRMA